MHTKLVHRRYASVRYYCKAPKQGGRKTRARIHPSITVHLLDFDPCIASLLTSSKMKLSFALIFALALTRIASEFALSLPGEHDLFKQQSERQQAPRNSIKLRGVHILQSPPKPFCSHPALYAFYVRTVLGKNGSTIAIYGEPPGDYGSQRCSGDQVFGTYAWIRDSGYGIRVATYVVLGLDQDDYHGPNAESVVRQK